MKLNNKLIYSFFLLLLILLFFNINTVFASISFDLEGNLIELPDFPSSIDTSHGYVIGIFNNEYFAWVLSNSNSYFYCTSSNTRVDISGTAFRCNLDNGVWVFRNGYSDTRTNTNVMGDVGSATQLVLSTVNIYSDINKTSVFIRPVLGVVVPALEKVEEIPQLMVQTLKILIPVGLIVLVIGFVILLIKRVMYLSQ